MELDQSSVPWYSTKTYTKDGVPLSFQFTIEIEFNGQDMREDCENISLQAHAMASLGFASNILKIPYVELPQKASEILRVSLNEAENKLNQEFGHTGDVRFVQFGVKNVIAVGLNARESNLMLLGGAKWQPLKRLKELLRLKHLTEIFLKFHMKYSIKLIHRHTIVLA